MSGGNVDGKSNGYPLGEKLFGSESRTKLGTSVGRSYGEVGYSLGSSVGIVDCNMKGSLLGGKSLGSYCGYEIVYYNGRSY